MSLNGISKSKEETLVSLLKKCSCMKVLEQILAHAIQLGYEQSLFVAGKIIVFCAVAEHGDMSYAVSVFEKTENPDAFIWNTMIRGFGKTNDAPKAFEFYKRMQERGLVADDFTFSFLLKVCGQLGSVLLGRQMHCITLNMGLINMSLLGTLLFMYMECSRILKHPANGYSQP